jgi:hypothetical protein
MSFSADVSWLPATKFSFSGMITVWRVLEAFVLGSAPAIVIG